MASGKPDLDSRERVEAFVDAFYARLLADPVMAPIFFDVADIDLAIHLPHIKDYWSKLLLGEAAYRRHTMNIHRAVHAKRTLDNADFDRWLQHFSAAIEQGYSGPGADRAVLVAATIAKNMQTSL
jgi:hemoglobin